MSPSSTQSCVLLELTLFPSARAELSLTGGRLVVTARTGLKSKRFLYQKEKATALACLSQALAPG